MMKRILFCAVFATALCGAKAQWSSDTTAGRQVSSGASTLSKANLVSVPDGAGGVFVAWIETQSPTVSKVFLQRLTADGIRVFPSDVTVSESSGTVTAVKDNLSMTPDSAGGVILIWQDYRARATTSGSKDEIYGQRVNAAGVRLWDTAGVRISPTPVSTNNRISPVVTMATATEAVVVFGDTRLGTSDLYAQKVNIANGASLWTVSGTADDVQVHGNQAGTSSFQTVLPDGFGGVYIVWQDPRLGNTNIDIYGQHLNTAGDRRWGAGGTLISSNANTANQTQPSAALDGEYGLVVTYGDFVNGSGDPNIWAQRVDSFGVKQWGNGVAVGVAALIQSNPYVVKSGSNFVIAWADQRLGVSNIRDIYAQALNANGALLWPSQGTPATDGVPVVQAPGNQPSSSTQSGYTIVSDSTGGAVIIWDDARGGSALGLYAQRLSGANGATLWTTNGVTVNNAAGAQQTPIAVLSTGQRVIVSWRDSRNGTVGGDIYAARLQNTGALPVRGLVVNAAAKGAAVDVQWNTIDESNTADFIVEKSADGVSFSAIGSAKARGTGNGSYALTDRQPVKGINHYRIKAVDVNKAFTYSAVVAVPFSSLPKATLAFYPNPVRNNITLQLSNLAKGSYQLSVRDLSGRTVLRQSLKIESPYAVFPVSVQGLAAGQYVMEVIGGGEAMRSQLTKIQ